MKKNLGYKVANVERTKRIGIAARSLNQFKTKIKSKFNIQEGHEFTIHLASDGSEVDEEDYFQSLPEQTLFIIAQGEKVTSDYDLVLSAMKNDFFETGKIIKEFMKTNVDRELVLNLILKAKNDLKEKTELSLKEEHVDWFQGYDSKYMSSKEDVMRRKAQDRIRGYFYKFKDEATKNKLYRSNSKARSLLLEIIESFKYLLIANNYFACLFDRTHASKINDVDELDAMRITKKRKIEIQNAVSNDEFANLNRFQKSLCNYLGEFKCFGPWFQTSCNYANHSINPYICRENLILFQTWNLDHQIEFSRTILPSLMSNVDEIVNNKHAMCKKHKQPAVQVSILSYFKEFFTISNLKLCHIVCHDKGSHALSSNGTLICEKCDEFGFLQKFNDLIKCKLY